MNPPTSITNTIPRNYVEPRRLLGCPIESMGHWSALVHTGTGANQKETHVNDRNQYQQAAHRG